MKKSISSGALRLLSVYVSAVLILSVFGCLSQLPASAEDIYTYTCSATLAGGNGTMGDPYQISNANELCKMVKDGGKNNGESAYYVLTDDISLNDTTNWSPDEGNSKKYAIWNVSSSADFAGNFNGQGYTISGLYAECDGFINTAADGAVITNVNFKDAYVSGGNWVGTVIGTANSLIMSYVTVTNAVVKNSSSWANTGTLVGLASDGKAASFSDCAIIKSNAKGAITGCASWNDCVQNITDCWAVECGNAKSMSCSGKNINITNCYLITKASSIKGASAKTAMPNLDWENVWQTGESNEYPRFLSLKMSGEGTKQSPFLVSNSVQLRKMVMDGGMKDRQPAYYALTDDISLNDTTNWSPDEGNTKQYHVWDVSAASDFVGNFNGQGYTISGLYAKCNGFINTAADGTVITNVNFKDVYVSGGNWVGAVIGTANNLTMSYVTVTNAAVKSSSSWANTGTLVGLAFDNKTASFTNCAVIKSNAQGVITGCASWNNGAQNMVNCWAVECSATSMSCAGNGVNTTNCYLITDPASIKGSSAKITMPALDWQNIWQPGTTGNYPTIRSLVWNGSTVSEPHLMVPEESNSSDNPYEIYTAAELFWVAKNYKTVVGYYKLCSDIYLNDVADSSVEESSMINQWVTVEKSNALNTGFSGTLDGDFHVIYGLYINDTSASDICSGLFPSLGSGAEIKNITLSKAQLTSDKGYIGGLTGCVIQEANVNIKNCLMDTSVELSAEIAGGLVASVKENACLSISDSAFTGDIDSKEESGAIVSDIASDTDVKLIRCFSTGSQLAHDQKVTYESCYQTGKSITSGIQTVSSDEMKGKSVKTIGMPGLDYDNVWLPQTNEYPVLRNPRKYGIVNSCWTGTIAEDYAINSASGKRGDGTKINPYIISTGEQLYRMLKVRESGAYYELSSDIYLNDTISAEWYRSENGINKWFDADTGSESNNGGWQLHLEGNGHSINGLYCEAGGWRSTGLIPVIGNGSTITNVHIRNSYYTGPEIAYGQKADNYIGGICGYAAPSAIVTIGGCTIDSSVNFEGGDNIAGIIAGNAGADILVERCGFAGVINSNGRLHGGIYADTWGALRINECYCIGAIAGAKDDDTHAHATQTYSTEDQSQSVGSKKLSVTQLDINRFTETYAKDSLNFKWNRWSFIDGYDYPFPKYVLSDINGIAGGVWSGNTANSYQPYTSKYTFPDNKGLEISEIDGTVIDPAVGDYYYGDGSDEYPYHIATGEQLVKMMRENCTNELVQELKTKQNSFLMVEDIYLNNTDNPNWISTEDHTAHDWLEGNYQIGFRGHFDGDGHIVYGMRFSAEKDWVITALFPVVGEGAVIEKVGVCNAYINNASAVETYAGGIVGYIQQYGTYVNISEELLRSDLEGYGLKDPIIRECFVYDSYFHAKNAGGIIGGMPAPVTVEDCYFVGTVSGSASTGAMVGNCWGGSGALQVKSSYCISTNYDKPIGGSSALGSSVIGGYVYTREMLTKFKLKHPVNMYGDLAYKHMPELFADHKACWQIVDGGTPVLSVFGSRASAYTYNTPIYTTVSFTTNVQDLICPSVTGQFGDSLTLPVPTREGYQFDGWYFYPELQCKAELTCVPRTSVNLFAKWTKKCITQDFENYPDTKYDRNPKGDYEYYKFGLKNYDSDYVHGGAKAMHRLGNTDAEEDILLNYSEPLTKGMKYRMTFWACAEKDFPDTSVSLVRNTWPDIDIENEPAKGINKIASLQDMKSGMWKQYTYYFTANTEWVSLRTTGNSSVYYDDVMLLPVGEGMDGIAKTRENTIPITCMVCAFMISSVILLLSKKKLKNLDIQSTESL